MTKEKNLKLDPEEMAEAGLHFGHKTSKTHPKMEPFIFGVRNTIHIIDLEKAKKEFEKALGFLSQLISEGKKLLLVGTKIQHKKLIESIAKECKLPFVNERWLGGTFTNFPVIKKRIEYFKDLERKKEEGEWEKYTKKERLKLEKELRELREKFEGLKNLEKLPDAVFLTNLDKDYLVVKESKRKGIKTVAICDTNTDPTLVDYPIPANDDAISSVKYILEKVKEVILKAQKAKSKKE